ncbi:hypothetical protein HK101_003508, partial [Irineochytrium annulatum]
GKCWIAGGMPSEPAATSAMVVAAILAAKVGGPHSRKPPDVVASHDAILAKISAKMKLPGSMAGRKPLAEVSISLDGPTLRSRPAPESPGHAQNGRPQSYSASKKQFKSSHHFVLQKKTPKVGSKRAEESFDADKASNGQKGKSRPQTSRARSAHPKALEEASTAIAPLPGFNRILPIDPKWADLPADEEGLPPIFVTEWGEKDPTPKKGTVAPSTQALANSASRTRDVKDLLSSHMASSRSRDFLELASRREYVAELSSKREPVFEPSLRRGITGKPLAAQTAVEAACMSRLNGAPWTIDIMRGVAGDVLKHWWKPPPYHSATSDEVKEAKDFGMQDQPKDKAQSFSLEDFDTAIPQFEPASQPRVQEGQKARSPIPPVRQVIGASAWSPHTHRKPQRHHPPTATFVSVASEPRPVPQQRPATSYNPRRPTTAPAEDVPVPQQPYPFMRNLPPSIPSRSKGRAKELQYMPSFSFRPEQHPHPAPPTRASTLLPQRPPCMAMLEDEFDDDSQLTIPVPTATRAAPALQPVQRPSPAAPPPAIDPPQTYRQLALDSLTEHRHRQSRRVGSTSSTGWAEVEELREEEIHDVLAAAEAEAIANSESGLKLVDGLVDYADLEDPVVEAAEGFSGDLRRDLGARAYLSMLQKGKVAVTRGNNNRARAKATLLRRPMTSYPAISQPMSDPFAFRSGPSSAIRRPSSVWFEPRLDVEDGGRQSKGVAGSGLEGAEGEDPPDDIGRNQGRP